MCFFPQTAKKSPLKDIGGDADGTFMLNAFDNGIQVQNQVLILMPALVRAKLMLLTLLACML